MFPQSIGCLFYSLNSIFHRAKLEIFLRSNLLLFSFTVMQLESCAKQNSLHNPILGIFSPVFSSKSFIIKKKKKKLISLASPALIVASRIFDLYSSMWDLLPSPGRGPWEQEVLTTGLSGKSLFSPFIFQNNNKETNKQLSKSWKLL